MQTNTNPKISEIVDFALAHSGYYRGVERDELERYASEHIRYNTLYWLPGVALARWNILPAGNVMHVIDLIIHPEYRSLRMLRFIALEIWKRNPAVNAFYYDREKNGERGSYGFNVQHWFKLMAGKKEKLRHGRKI